MAINENIPPLKWLFLDLNSYFASVEQQDRPALRGKPVAVVPMMTDSTCAIAASYEAKAFGIKTGTMIYEAKKMCPGLICVKARHDVYVDYHHRIFHELQNHIPITMVCSIDEVACQLLGAERKPENVTKLAHQIKKGLWEHVGPAINCSIGVASNRFLAKTASNMQKPDGLVLLQEQDLPQALFALKLTDLTGINVNMLRRLHSGGVTSVEEFYHLAPKQARAIWGSVGGERFWYNLHGHDIEEGKTQKRVVGHSRVLEPASRAPDQAYTIIRQLTIKAASRLRRYELYAAALELKVRSVNGEKWVRSHRIEPSQSNADFLAILKELWQLMIAEMNKVHLKQVAVTLHNLQAGETITLDLFSSKQTQTDKKQDKALSDAMDKINQRYGSSTLQLGTLDKEKVGTKIAFTRIPEKEEFLD
jgi:DNA polymerase-4